MASANPAADFISFPEHPLQNPPNKDLPECPICRGWGVILGTDTPDSWGEPCACGRDFDRPVGVMAAQELHAAHMQARLNGVRS